MGKTLEEIDKTCAHCGEEMEVFEGGYYLLLRCRKDQIVHMWVARQEDSATEDGESHALARP